MNGDWIFVVFLVISFILIIIAAILEHNAALLVEKHAGSDVKLQKAAGLLEINLGLGLGISISGLIFVLIAMLLLAFVPLVLAVMGLFPIKMIGKIIYGIIIIALGVTVILLSSCAISLIQNSDTYTDLGIDDLTKNDLNLALGYNMMAFGLFIGLTVVLFLLFVGMALYDIKKARNSTENLINESVDTVLKFSENIFKKVRSHYDEDEKYAVDDNIKINNIEDMIDMGIDNIVNSIKKNKNKHNKVKTLKNNTIYKDKHKKSSNTGDRINNAINEGIDRVVDTLGSKSSESIGDIVNTGVDGVVGSFNTTDRSKNGRKISKDKSLGYMNGDNDDNNITSKSVGEIVDDGLKSVVESIKRNRRTKSRS